MADARFWDLIAKLDWARAGDDEAVCRPVVEALTALPVAAIQAFEEILAQKLHALDTEGHAREIGEEAFTGSRDDFAAAWRSNARFLAAGSCRSTCAPCSTTAVACIAVRAISPSPAGTR